MRTDAKIQAIQTVANTLKSEGDLMLFSDFVRRIETALTVEEWDLAWQALDRSRLYPPNIQPEEYGPRTADA